MDLITYALCRKLIKRSIESLGDIFTLKGNVDSVQSLPSTGNKVGDIYLVGPHQDGSYDEYYWTSNNNWEIMGSTGPGFDGVITEEAMYKGEDGTGTIENPAEGTILDVVNSKVLKTETWGNQNWENGTIEIIGTEPVEKIAYRNELCADANPRIPSDPEYNENDNLENYWDTPEHFVEWLQKWDQNEGLYNYLSAIEQKGTFTYDPTQKTIEPTTGLNMSWITDWNEDHGFSTAIYNGNNSFITEENHIEEDSETGNWILVLGEWFNLFDGRQVKLTNGEDEFFIDGSDKSNYILKELEKFENTKGKSYGLAELDENGKVLTDQLPNLLNDIVEGYYYNNKFYEDANHTIEITGESGKFYVDLSTNIIYRWDGTKFIEVTEDSVILEIKEPNDFDLKENSINYYPETYSSSLFSDPRFRYLIENNKLTNLTNGNDYTWEEYNNTFVWDDINEISSMIENDIVSKYDPGKFLIIGDEIKNSFMDASEFIDKNWPNQNFIGDLYTIKEGECNYIYDSIDDGSVTIYKTLYYIDGKFYNCTIAPQGSFETGYELRIEDFSEIDPTQVESGTRLEYLINHPEMIILSQELNNIQETIRINRLKALLNSWFDETNDEKLNNFWASETGMQLSEIFDGEGWTNENANLDLTYNGDNWNYFYNYYQLQDIYIFPYDDKLFEITVENNEITNIELLDISSDNAMLIFKKNNIEYNVGNQYVKRPGDSMWGTLKINSKDSALRIGFNDNSSPENMGMNSIAIGSESRAMGNYSYARGNGAQAIGDYSYADGNSLLASGYHSHSEGTGYFYGYGSITISGEANATTYKKIGGYTSIYVGGVLQYSSSTAKIISISGDIITVDKTLSQDTAINSGTAYFYLQGEASGNYSHTEGYYTIASKDGAFAQGRATNAGGKYSHAEGQGTLTTGESAHAEGNNTIANGYSSHAEGYGSYAGGYGSHAEGYAAYSGGEYSHAEGKGNGARTYIKISGEAQSTIYTVNESSITIVPGDILQYGAGNFFTVIAVPDANTIVLNRTMGSAKTNITASIFKSGSIGQYSHSEGNYTTALGDYSHSEGNYTIAQAAYSHAEGFGKEDTWTTTATINTVSMDAETGLTTIDVTLPSEDYGYTFINGYMSSYKKCRIVWESSSITINRTLKFITDTYTTLQPGANITIHLPIFNSVASGSNGSHVEGFVSIASGQASHAEGQVSEASGARAHAEGKITHARGAQSHAEGEITYAIGQDSHTEGVETYAFGASSHAEGGISANRAAGTFTISSLTREVTVEGKKYTKIGFSAYTFSNYLEALVIFANGSPYAFVNFDENNDELYFSPSMTSSDFNTLSVGDTVPIYYCGNLTLGTSAHAEGLNTAAKGDWSHTEGYSTSALRTAAHAEGHYSIASKDYAHAEGANTTASGMYGSHAEGYFAIASGEASHAEGKNTTASGNYSHAGGMLTKASGGNSYAEGYNTIASGEGSHAEGFFSQALGDYSHAEGIGQSSSPSQTTVTVRSHTIPSSDDNDESVINVLASWNFLGGYFKFNNHYFRIINFTRASNEMPYYNCTIKPGFTITEAQSITDDTTTLEVIYFGQSLLALGECSHAEGSMSQAIGILSHAEGQETIASGSISHTEGTGTIAEGNNQHVQGTFNIVDTTSAHIVGNGTGPNAKSNAHTLDTSGNAWFAGDVYVYSTSGTNKDSGSKRLITEDEVMTLLQQIINTNNLIDPFQD